MRSIFHIELVSPVRQPIGAYSNKSIAFEHISGVVKDNSVIVDEDSDRFLAFHKKQMNYINFTKYFKDTKNKAKLTLKIVSPDPESEVPIIKKLTCTMFVVNQ